MKKVLKNKCSLEEEYAFEHNARVKAEKYIEELWKMHGELENEVSRLQKIVTDNGYVDKEKVLLSAKISLNKRVDKIHEERKESYNKLNKLVKGALND